MNNFFIRVDPLHINLQAPVVIAINHGINSHTEAASKKFYHEPDIL